jgi:hypothetical protein
MDRGNFALWAIILIIVVILMGPFFKITGNQILTSPLVGHWSFDADTISDNKVKDLSGKGNDCTMVGVTSVEGKYGEGFSFDGIDDYLYCGASDDLAGEFDEITILSWIKTSDKGLTNGYIIGDMNSRGGYKFQTYAGAIWANFRETDILFSPWVSKQGIADDKWHIVAITYSQNRELMKIYVDGRLIESKSWSGTIGRSINGMYMGKLSNFNGLFKGELDEVKIFNKELSEEEILLEIGSPVSLVVRDTILNYPVEKPIIKLKIVDSSIAPKYKVTIDVDHNGANTFHREILNLVDQEIVLDFSGEVHEEQDLIIKIIEKETEIVIETQEIILNLIKKKDLKKLIFLSFSTPKFPLITQEKIDIINPSPYDALAISLTYAYDSRSISKESIRDQIDLVKGSDREFWPWIYMNKMYGLPDEGDSCYSNCRDFCEDKAYYETIKGIDIDNEVGALAEFYKEFETSLQIAEETGATGIIIDDEAYNNACVYDIKYVAQKQEITVEQAKTRLKEIGREMANKAESEYPGVTILFLFPTLDEEAPIGNIILGMLEEGKEKGHTFKVVEGGEKIPLHGYVSCSIEHLKEKSEGRYKQYKDLVNLYPNLHLGGTIAPFYDIEGVEDEGDYTWLNNLLEECGESLEVNKIEDLVPLIRYFSETVEYLWIYGAGAAPYTLREDQFTRFNPFIGGATGRVRDCKLKDDICNGIDDDCNGGVDEDYVESDTSCGVGICSENKGGLTCSNGVEVNSCDPFEGAKAESCEDNSGYDGLDNNCDGKEDLDCENHCDKDGDKYTSKEICVNEVYAIGDCDDTNSKINPGEVELCDGHDNNCKEGDDGMGELWFGDETSCGVGVCSNTGKLICKDGKKSNSCVVGEGLVNDKSCDGLDNDCNGEIDEDYVESDTSCGVGICSNGGELSCKGGGLVDSCTEKTGSSEDSTCDGFDDDCDGEIDEDCVQETTSARSGGGSGGGGGGGKTNTKKNEDDLDQKNEIDNLQNNQKNLGEENILEVESPLKTQERSNLEIILSIILILVMIGIIVLVIKKIRAGR